MLIDCVDTRNERLWVLSAKKVTDEVRVASLVVGAGATSDHLFGRNPPEAERVEGDERGAYSLCAQHERARQVGGHDDSKGQVAPGAWMQVVPHKRMLKSSTTHVWDHGRLRSG